LQNAINLNYHLRIASDYYIIACKTKVIIYNRSTKTMRKAIIALGLAGLLASCNSAKTQSPTENNQSKTTTMSKKETVGTFLGAVMKNDPTTMRKVANADYILTNVS